MGIRQGHYRSVVSGADILERGYRGLNECRYCLKARVNESLDAFGSREVLDVVKPVMPVLRAVEDRGLRSWRGHDEGFDIEMRVVNVGRIPGL